MKRSRDESGIWFRAPHGRRPGCREIARIRSVCPFRLSEPASHFRAPGDSNPPRILIAVSHPGYHQLQSIAAAIWFPKSDSAASQKAPGLQGFCHGATPFSRAAMMLSVISWRRSLMTDGVLGIHRGSLHSESDSGISASKPDPRFVRLLADRADRTSDCLSGMAKTSFIWNWFSHKALIPGQSCEDRIPCRSMAGTSAESLSW